MGELDRKPFLAAAKKIYHSEEEEEKASKVFSFWENYLRDPNWHPYMIIQKCQITEEIIDENNEKIKKLKAKYGDEVYQAMVTALNELNEYNPSGNYPVAQLWNNKEKRDILLNEGVEFILKQWKSNGKKQNKHLTKL